MKFKIVALALVAALGLGTIAAVAAKPKKVKSTVTIRFDPGQQSNPNDYSNSSFKGKVGSKKKKCRKGRSVTVKEVGVGNVGTDKTDKKGKYRVPAGHVMEPDEYSEFSTFYAVAKKKRKGNTICKKAKSPIIVAP